MKMKNNVQQTQNGKSLKKTLSHCCREASSLAGSSSRSLSFAPLLLARRETKPGIRIWCCWRGSHWFFCLRHDHSLCPALNRRFSPRQVLGWKSAIATCVSSSSSPLFVSGSDMSKSISRKALCSRKVCKSLLCAAKWAFDRTRRRRFGRASEIVATLGKSYTSGNSSSTQARRIARKLSCSRRYPEIQSINTLEQQSYAAIRMCILLT